MAALSLFGSVARDEARPDSDVDLLVEFAGPPSWRGYLDLKLLLEDLLGASVDLAMSPIRPEIAESVHRELLRVA